MTKTKGHFPHGDVLKRARKEAGGLGMERAASRIEASRSTWDSWERQGMWPSEENLRALVEVFGIPPAEIGYEPPAGWEMVPAAWIREQNEMTHAMLRDVLERLQHIR